MILKLNNVRIAYPHLFTPSAYLDNKNPKYEVTLLIDKTNKKMLQTINDAFGEQIKFAFGSTPSALKHCMKDGAEKQDNFTEYVIIKAKNQRRPTVVDHNRSPVTADDGLINDGCFVNVIVNISAYTSAFGKFASAEVRGVQYVSAGEPFGTVGKVCDSEDFDVVEFEPNDDNDDEAFH